MIQRVYSIYDRKALIYHTPFFAVNDQTAVRMLTDLVGDNATAVARHPNDYVMYCIGGYDDQKGELLPISPILHVCDANSVVPPSSGGAPFFADLSEATAEAVSKLRPVA